MRICYLTIEFDGGGGLSSYIHTIGTELIKKGHEVIVITKGKKTGFSREDGMEIHRLALGNFHYYLSKIPILRIFALPIREFEWSFAFGRTLRKLVFKKKIDIIESCETGNFFGVLFHPGIPWIIRTHGSTVSFKKYSGEKLGVGENIDRLLRSYCMKKVQGLSTPSKFQGREVLSEIKGKIPEVIPNPVSFTYKEVYENANSQTNNKTVLFTGRLAKVKGIYTLLNAAYIVCNKLSNVKFVLVGPDHVSISNMDLKKFIKQKGLTKNVKIVGAVPFKAVGNFYKECSVFVMPSYFETFCISVAEAMAFGKPVVGTAGTGLSELVDDGICGLLVPPGDYRALANGILKLLSNCKLARTMGRSGREKVLRLYKPQRVADSSIKFYQKVIKDFL